MTAKEQKQILMLRNKTIGYREIVKKLKNLNVFSCFLRALLIFEIIKRPGRPATLSKQDDKKVQKFAKTGKYTEN